MITTGLMSSESPNWATPPGLFASLSLEYGPFDLDVCAEEWNTKCTRFFTPRQDGLKQDWKGVCWMNPPYGNPEQPCRPVCTKKKCRKRGWHAAEYIPGIRDWVRKAKQESQRGATVVCLLPARTDTRWWHQNIEHDAHLKRFLQGRIRFLRRDGSTGPAPFPSCVVVFRPPSDTSPGGA